MTKRHKVLVIDDDRDTRLMIADILSDKYEVIAAADGEEGLRMARIELPDLILLDVTMPKLDGLSVCEALRTKDATRHIPIIMLTALTDVDSRIKSFFTGADDYVPKPFKPRELVARVASKMRRVEERLDGEEALVCGNLKMDLKKLEVSVGGAILALSVLELDLLKYFLQNKERVMSRDRILETVWHDRVVSDRTVDTHIVSLRKKLAGFDHQIHTIYGAGYVLKKT